MMLESMLEHAIAIVAVTVDKSTVVASRARIPSKLRILRFDLNGVDTASSDDCVSLCLRFCGPG